MSKINRRNFLLSSSVCLAATGVQNASAHTQSEEFIEISDQGWNLWLDKSAKWQDDDIFLPKDVNLEKLPINTPTIGWNNLGGSDSIKIDLPSTVEQHFWGTNGLRPYTSDEYRYAEVDNIPQYGAYTGVSWWWRSFEISQTSKGNRVILHVPGARFRAEVFVNQKLVGYSIMAEIPFNCDITEAVKTGASNQIAIRITNPGGRFDWRDSTTMKWGKYKFFASHGFGGIDGGFKLSVHPMPLYIEDAWILNTPYQNKIFAFIKIKNHKFKGAIQDLVSLQLFDSKSNLVGHSKSLLSTLGRADTLTLKYELTAQSAELWDLESPNLYNLKATLQLGANKSIRNVRFGFRWFSIDGLGSDAHLRLNSKRIKLYSAISWGYWGYNGLWPTKILAQREIYAAKDLGLNCLHAHRNIAKKRVIELQDERGLLRVVEPGGGRHALPRDLKPGETLNFEDGFSREYMFEKCRMMARMFRSHPSVAHYTLQNEISANLANPDVRNILKAIHDEDPSRIVILNDGFVERGAAQAMFLPYDEKFYNSNEVKWGGWWVNHQGAGDQWYDKFYKSKDDYIHRQTYKPAIIEFGEMQGCAVPDNHTLMAADIMANGGKSYDLIDHIEIIEATNQFIRKWGFDTAFTSSEALFLSIGRKSYESWQNYMENIRIGNEVDIGVISGWESTAIENHSGIVDNLRYFKAPPDLIKNALLPIRAIAKQKKLVYETGEIASFDIYFFNDTNKEISGDILISIQEPDGKTTLLNSFKIPNFEADVFSYLVAEDFKCPILEKTGSYKINVAVKKQANFSREIWVVENRVDLLQKKIAIIDIPQTLEAELRALSGLNVENFLAGNKYDCIITSGLVAADITKRQIGEQTGQEAQPTKDTTKQDIKGHIAQKILDEFEMGVPLFIYAPDDYLADGIAEQLSQRNYFRYEGQVGNLRAPWMGNWNFIRKHPIYEGIPSDQATNTLHQVEGQSSNGLLIDGSGIEIIGAYSRDHDRKIGAATFIYQNGPRRLLFHRMPDLVQPLQRRLLSNIISFLTEERS